MNSKEPKAKRNYIYHMIRDVREVNGLKLKPTHNAVLVFIESRGVEAFPSHDTLAKDCGMGVTKTKSVLAELKNHGLIDWKAQGGHSHRYKINRSVLQDAYFEIKGNELEEDQSEWDEFHPDWDI